MEHKIDYDGFRIKSPAMQNVFGEVADYAVHGYPLILFGPSGTGKEFLAKYYHNIFSKNKFENRDFNSLNCAGLSKDTAISELFGHVKGAFTGATKDKPGIFETTNGVLFLDEFGDIHPEVQAMLLRAVDTKIREGKRLGANKPYKIENVIVIAATEQPKENLRESLLARMGAEINVPGINQRKEDVLYALQFFCKSAILEKRVDSQKIIISLLADKEILQEGINNKNQLLDKFSVDISKMLTPLVQAREWSGNFRSVGNVVHQSVIRAKNTNNYLGFIEDIVFYFKENSKKYSQHNYPEFEKQFTKNQSGIPLVEIKEEWYPKVKNAFPNLHEQEVRKIAGFLSQFFEVEFTRGDFQNYLGSECSNRTAQIRLKDLAVNSLLTYRRQGSKYIYRVNGMDYKKPLIYSKPEFLALPELKQNISNRNKELEQLNDILKNAHGLFLSGQKRSGKTTLAIALGNELKNERPVYYFSFKQGDVEQLLIQVFDELKNGDSLQSFSLNLQGDISLEAEVAFVSGYLNQNIYAERKPLLILDETDFLTTQKQQQGLLAIIRFWQFFDVLLVGEKMGNETVFEKFVEYKIS